MRLWIPYPVSDENQDIWDIQVNGNFSSSGVYRESENGNIVLYAEWNGPSKDRTLTYSFKVKRKEVVKKNFPKKELLFSKEEFSPYLKPTSHGPTTGKVKELADKITRGKKTNLAKSKAEGLIHYALQFCHTYNIEAIKIKEICDKEGIPFLAIETDYSTEDVGQLQTRIEAFLEQIKG